MLVGRNFVSGIKLKKPLKTFLNFKNLKIVKNLGFYQLW